MKCPHCSSTEVFKSKSGNAKLVWPLRWFVVCVRCHNCSKRFYRRGMLLGGEEIPTPTAHNESARVDGASVAKKTKKKSGRQNHHGIQRLPRNTQKTRKKED